MNDDDYKKAYSKGYSAGSRHSWPLHKPPEPPNEVVARLMACVSKLRDGVDGQLALFDEDDDIVIVLGPLIDDVDAVFEQIGEWVTSIAATSGD